MKQERIRTHMSKGTTGSKATGSKTQEKQQFLTKEEELRLGKIIQAHNSAKKELAESSNLDVSRKAELEQLVASGAGEEAINTLVEANVRLVWKLASNFRKRYPLSPPLEDLVQDGSIGLMTAVHKYDPERENKFSTLAYHWINQAIARQTNNTGRMVRLPENRVGELSKIISITNSEEAANLSPVEVDELIMKKLNISRDVLRRIRSASASPVSINKIASRGDGGAGGTEIVDLLLKDKNTAPMPADQVGYQDSMAILSAAIRDLPEENKAVLAAHYSLSDETPEQVRKRYDLSLSKYKRVLNDGVSMLRGKMSEQQLTFSDFVSPANMV